MDDKVLLDRLTPLIIKRLNGKTLATKVLIELDTWSVERALQMS